ncbi:MAG: agmatinase [Dehalococcoidia bacterium]|nr:agmatinase [Dehalococcoidia bacterium]
MTNLHGDDPHPAFVGLPTYLHLPFARDAAELKSSDADIAILGAPVDMGVVYRPGTRFGPRAIRDASYFTASRTLYHLGLDVDPLEFLKVVDFGDANCPPSDLQLSHDAVKAKVGEALDADTLPIVLGGDHSITLPSATAVADKYGHGNVGILHFDAHADTGESGYGGVLIAHGNPMRRLIESGAVPGKNFVQVGLRGYWPPKDTFDWMREQGMRWHLMSEIETRGFDEVIAEAISEALDGADHLYLSVDIDVADPAFAPGTGTPEPGGLSGRELLRAVRRIVGSDVHLVAMDVVEVSPPYDSSDITAQLAHRVVLEAISALATKKRDSGS